MISCPAVRSETLAESARAEAKRIAATLSPAEPVRIQVRNLSSLSTTQLVPARQAIEAEFQGRAAEPDPAIATFTLSEDAAGYLWVGEIVRAGKREGVFIQRAGLPAPSREASPSIMLTKTLLWEQADPVLDAVPAGDTLVLLTPREITFRSRQGSGWALQKQIPIPQTKPWPRDMRGRISLEGDSIRVLLPGMSCTGVIRPDPAADCTTAAGNWPGLPANATLADGRNYFSAGGAQFYSAAAAGNGWVLARTDGSAQLAGAALEPVANLGEWGSDVAAIETPCSATQILATKSAGPQDGDAIQAYTIRDNAAWPSSAPLDFAGPITAMWPSADRQTAIAVSRDNPGKYAAYSVSVTCR